DVAGSTRLADELTSIIAGIYNVRGGHTDFSTERLKSSVDKEDQFLQMAPSKSIPMNWVFSQGKIETINRDVNTLLKAKDAKKFFESLQAGIEKSIQK
ncbi:MAG: hypothetical protein ACKO96_28550, partial [Flammeovirgaceae bacterium]